MEKISAVWSFFAILAFLISRNPVSEKIGKKIRRSYCKIETKENFSRRRNADMIVAGKIRCVNCMKKMNIVRHRCLRCGFRQETYQPLPYHMNPGTVLANRYSIGRVLGEGNFGIVYLAWDLVLEQKTAIKEYFPKNAIRRDWIRGVDAHIKIENDKKFAARREQFEKEAGYLSRFSRLDNVCRVVDYFNENGTAYIVTQYIEGMSLEKYMEKYGKFNEAQTISLLLPLVQSLAEIHKTGLLHRDINPSNIIYQEQKKLVLTDFGSMQMAGQKKSLQTQCTAGYSPHEQYLPEGKEGPWTDSYALCAVMHYMLTGKAPEKGVWEDEPDISEKCRKILEKGLSGYEKDRYVNMSQLEARLNYEVIK